MTGGFPYKNNVCYEDDCQYVESVENRACLLKNESDGEDGIPGG